MSYDSKFSENFRELKRFYRKYGHYDVPSKPGKIWLKNLSDDQTTSLKRLGRFVETLRRQRKLGELSRYKIDMLNHIGFTWLPASHKQKEEHWNKMITRLIAFKKRYGHTRVPEKWQQDEELAAFVVSCRIVKKRGRISDYKVNFLNSIGFEWAPNKIARKRDKKGKFLNELAD